MSLKRQLKKLGIIELKRHPAKWQSYFYRQLCCDADTYHRMKRAAQMLVMMRKIIESKAAERELYIRGKTAYMVVMDEDDLGNIQVKHLPLDLGYLQPENSVHDEWLCEVQSEAEERRKNRELHEKLLDDLVWRVCNFNLIKHKPVKEYLDNKHAPIEQWQLKGRNKRRVF